MTDDFISAGLMGATAALDIDARPWMVGLARIVNAPFDKPDEAVVEEIFQVSNQTVEFPSGPLGFPPGGYDREYRECDDYSCFRMSSPELPGVEELVGWGPAGFVSVAMRNNTDPYGTGRAGVLMADYESVIADTYTLALATAVAGGFCGPIDFAFAILDERPDPTLDLYAIHDITGELCKTHEAISGVMIVEHRLNFDLRMEAREVHEDLLQVAHFVAPQFGVNLPELVSTVPESPNMSLEVPLEAFAPWQR